MLGGRSALGNILFKDAGIILHDIEEPGPFRLRTRWTLTVCFKALPWQPVPRFTGISEYTIDDQARVIKQEDYWDSINLVKGRYQAVSALDGVRDFVGQVLPSPAGAATGGLLLRRAKDYEVRRQEVQARRRRCRFSVVCRVGSLLAPLLGSLASIGDFSRVDVAPLAQQFFVENSLFFLVVSPLVFPSHAS
ncbi:unnamed protein product [Ectocarpus sp. 12 AP-2014]